MLSSPCRNDACLFHSSNHNRTLALNASLSFHKSYWEADSIEKYYNKGKDDGDWENHFEFASWIYENFSETEYSMEIWS
tara:strand:+ start:188 stop:424 length:237 start_codon:yes stop_codon:yes gene_type:complete